MPGTVERRGLLAGAAALVAASLAKLSGTERANAGHDSLLPYLPTTVLHLGQSNGIAGPTKLTNVSATVAIPDYDVSGAAMVGRGRDNWAGVQGYCFGPEGWGHYGASDQGIGVVGAIVNTSQSRGYPDGSFPVNTGVWGVSELGGTGVVGTSPSGRGVHGTSDVNVGVLGGSTSNVGVYGGSERGVGVQAFSTSHWALYATTAVQGGFAGVFNGSVYINGSYTATGAKSAAVPHPDGSHRRMYAQEAPEPWFEDFGEAELAGGRAVVQLDPDFDAVVKGDNYQVFLTEYGAPLALYVADRRPHAFVVRSDKGPAVSGTFGYRVVARRKDPVGGRMEKVDLPNLNRAPKAVNAQDVSSRTRQSKPPAGPPPSGR